jgi:branched-chain amino acid transport system substrate-binding protein
VPNTAWGRSSEAAAMTYGRSHPELRQTTHWYNWGDTDFTATLRQAKAEGIQALIMVANEAEGSLMVKQMAALPADQRLPIISHWGIAGGDFAALTGSALKAVDLVVVQTFSFSGNSSVRAKAVAASVRRRFGHDVTSLHGQVGFAHAYDFTYLLAAALRKAGRTERSAVRAALERIEAHDGLVRNYRRPFGPNDHEALDRSQLFMAHFDGDGNLRAVAKR